MKTIAIIGATGRLGAPVARAFQQQGYKVRLISRDINKLVNQFNRHEFEFQQADLFDLPSLQQALQGAEAIHINLGGNSPQSYIKNHVQGTEQILKAVDKSCIQLISMISTASAYPKNDFRTDTQAKLQAEALIKQSGINYLVYLPSWFYETLNLFVDEQQITMIGDSTQKLHWLSAQDYANAVVESYKQPALHNRRLTLFGPEALTIKQAATKFAQTLKYSMSYLSFKEAREIALQSGDEQFIDDVDLLDYTEKVGEEVDSTTLEHPLSFSTTLDSWLKMKGLNPT